MKIATQLRSGQLRGIHVPSEQREQYRILSRLRNDLAVEKTRTGNKLKGLLLCHGLLSPDDDRKVSKRWIKELMSRSYSKEIARAIKTHVTTWQYYGDQIASLEEELKAQACDDLALERIYRSAPGIGPTAARILANELGDMSQFSHEKKLFSYLGLTPCEYSSGEHIHRGRISRQGKPILRKVLIQAAWRAIRFDAGLLEDYDRIRRSSGKKRAIVAVARRLAGRLRSCLQKGEEYKLELVEEKQQAV